MPMGWRVARYGALISPNGKRFQLPWLQDPILFDGEEERLASVSSTGDGEEAVDEILRVLAPSNRNKTTAFSNVDRQP